jgi:two-component system, OmpR family, sensor kinase
MQSSRLYIRTALHIGIAIVAFVLISAICIWVIATTELRGYIETRNSSLGQTAAEVLINKGEKGLIQWMQDKAEIPDNVSVYILNKSGIDILGRELPKQYSTFISEHVVADLPRATDTYLPTQLAPRIIGPDNQVYAVLVIPKGISLWGNRAMATGLLLVAILVIASVAWLIAKTISKPISQLQLVVRDLSLGTTDARAPRSLANRGDEIGVLAADFNVMANKIKQLIDSRELLFQEMSHELRSPLARLQAALALAVESNMPTNDVMQKVEPEIERMDKAIGDMLRYSSLDKSITPKSELVRINRLLEKLIDSETTEALRKNCSMNLEIEKELIVIGDPELLARGFENIIRNSIRYTENGTAVDISAYQSSNLTDENKHITVIISDKGPGVSEKNINKIFEPYFKIKNEKHPHESTGLGLAIVKRVFEHHDGNVFAFNRDGGGLSIIVKLPQAVIS